jgi:hypothetical protein
MAKKKNPVTYNPGLPPKTPSKTTPKNTIETLRSFQERETLEKTQTGPENTIETPNSLQERATLEDIAAKFQFSREEVHPAH